MGACDFSDIVRAPKLEDAFNEARQRALYDYGHAGYTGTIAEKPGYIYFELPLNKVRKLKGIEHTPDEIVRRINNVIGFMDYDGRQALSLDELKNLKIKAKTWEYNARRDAVALLSVMGHNKFIELISRYYDKWGPAIAFKVAPKTWAFMGMASC